MKQSGSILFSLIVFCVLISISLSAVADGKSQYGRYCGECHGLTLKGSGHGPELAGPLTATRDPFRKFSLLPQNGGHRSAKNLA